MATVDFHGKAYEVRTAPDPRLRCSLCAVRGCRGAAPCMDLPVGSYLWTEPVRRPDPPRLTVPVPGARRPEPLPAPEEKRGGRGGGRLKPLPEGLAQRVAKAGRDGERADVVARREGISLALVYKTWRLEGVYEVRGKRPAQKSLGDMQVGNGRRQHMGGTGKPGRPAEAIGKIRKALEKEPAISNTELARRLGYSREYIGKVRREAGLPRPPLWGTQSSIAARPGVVEYVREHNGEGNEAIAGALGVGVSTVAHLRAVLGLSMSRPRTNTGVTEQQLAFIREHAGEMTDVAMANALDVPAMSVSRHRRAMGLPPSRKYTECRKKAQARPARRTKAWKEAQVMANPDMDMKGLMALTGMSPGGVSKMRKRLGLPPMRTGRPRKEEEGHAEEDDRTGV